jgi:uncharacterized protein (TIGR03118 family)
MKNATLRLMLLALAPTVLPAASGYLAHNLVADTAGVADFTDPNLVNAWGISISATSPFWLCDGGTGLSTVYTSSATTFAVSATKAAIPPSGNGANTVCTGIVANSTTGFTVSTATVAARAANFIFATEGGTISGWSSGVDATHAIMAIDNSAAGAVYKGLALVTATTPTAQLYAANFSQGTIDVFDTSWKPVTLAAGTFTDPAIPAGFAPFNIQLLSGSLYVTYAKQGATKVFDAPGVGNGYVDVYDVNGKLLQHLVSQGPLNSPWGVQIAPATFGPFGGALLVGNFGDGLIHAFDVKSGALLGTLSDQNGNNIRIDGLWGLQFGNGGSGGDVNSLYFAAGPSAQKHGLFGIIVSNPILTENVVNGANVLAEVAPNTVISVIGGSLSPTTRSWAAADFKGNQLPTSLDGVSVTINGAAAYPFFVSPRQINVLTPTNMPVSSPVQVVVSDNGMTSTSLLVPTSPFGPALFMQSGNKYAVAQHGDGTLVGPKAGTVTPASAGETIALYATGLGATNPATPNGQTLAGPSLLAVAPTVLIDGAPAGVSYSGLIAPGLYQVNATLPAGLSAGDHNINLVIGGYPSPGGVFIAVQ